MDEEWEDEPASDVGRRRKGTNKMESRSRAHFYRKANIETLNQLNSRFFLDRCWVSNINSTSPASFFIFRLPPPGWCRWMWKNAEKRILGSHSKRSNCRTFFIIQRWCGGAELCLVKNIAYRNPSREESRWFSGVLMEMVWEELLLLLLPSHFVLWF